MIKITTGLTKNAYEGLSEEQKAARSREFQRLREEKKNARREKNKAAKQRKKPKRQTKAARRQARVTSDIFLESYEWRKLRYRAIQKYDRACMCCGRKPPQVQLHVDHIKPRKKYPDMALDINNLQILCHECNHGKGNWDETDWRNGTTVGKEREWNVHQD